VTANLDDYAQAYKLLSPIFDSLAAEGLTPAISETVEAVRGEEEVTEAELARRLAVSKATIHYRVERAIRGGWLRNSETRKFHPARLSRGAPLPDVVSALPSPERLRQGFEGSNGCGEDSAGMRAADADDPPCPVCGFGLRGGYCYACKAKRV
jgi:hypothetical protein